MKLRLSPLTVAATLFAAGCSDNNSGTPTSPQSGSAISFFVSSAKSTTGNLGGLAGADNLCQSLATTVGAGNKLWQAYLSVERDRDNKPTDARSRIGTGPWVNANGIVVAQDLNQLHSRTGDAAVFVDERGQRIPGQWAGSPPPVEHDILTGSNADGTLMPGFTCNDWTSESATLAAQVGHTDGMGPNGSTVGPLSSWNSSHTSQNCANTAPRGGAGRIYCFARN